MPRSMDRMAAARGGAAPAVAGGRFACDCSVCGSSACGCFFLGLIFQPQRQKLMLDLDGGGDLQPSPEPQRAYHWLTAIPATRRPSSSGTTSGGTSHARVCADNVIDCSFPDENARQPRRASRRSERAGLLLLCGLLGARLGVALGLLGRGLGLGRGSLRGFGRALLLIGHSNFLAKT